MSRAPYLTKSSYVRGTECDRLLWLSWHQRQPYEAPVPGSPAATGIDIGTKAHQLFPGGVLVDHEPWEHEAAVARTQQLMSDPAVPAIFEAAYEHAGVRIRADVVERLSDGRWRLCEVKSASRVKARYIDDAAVQAFVMEQSGIKLASVELVHVNTSYVYAGDSINWQQYFKRSEITDQVAAAKPDIEATVHQQMELLNHSQEPAIKPGPHCPADCNYWDHCTANKPADWIFNLPRLSQKKFDALQSAGIERIANIPDDFNLTAHQDRMRDVIANRKPYISNQLASDIAVLEGPVAYLDFEAMNPAIPIYSGTRPYQRTPFQWSLHRDDGTGSLSHDDFLGDPSDDPRETFVTSLVAALANDDQEPIVVYSPYEKSVLREMSELFHVHSDALERIIARLVDLYVIVRNNLYLESFAGSYSIKMVGKALAPDFSYDGLEHVADGAQAAAAYQRLAGAKVADDEASELRTALLAYCRLDTLAMVKAHRGLRDLAGPG
jgi:predicted RecB family nuclease